MNKNLLITLITLTMLTNLTTASPLDDLTKVINEEKSKPKLNVSIKVIQDEKYTNNILNLLAENKHNSELKNCIKPILDVAESEEDAYFITAVMLLESDWGRSKICKDKNNYFSYRAYDRDAYNNAKTYDSFEESLADFVMLINTYNTKYNLYTIGEIGTRYSSSDEWANKVKVLIEQLKEYDKDVSK